MNVSLDDVQVRGIRKVEKEDLQMAEKLGFTMKLIGKAEKQRTSHSFKCRTDAFTEPASIIKCE